MSFEKRANIRPIGVMEKKNIGALKIFESKEMCNTTAAWKTPSFVKNSAKNWKTTGRNLWFMKNLSKIILQVCLFIFFCPISFLFKKHETWISAACTFFSSTFESFYVKRVSKNQNQQTSSAQITKSQISGANELSTTSMSFEKRERILPVGVTSKKLLGNRIIFFNK